MIRFFLAIFVVSCIYSLISYLLFNVMEMVVQYLLKKDKED